MGHLVTGMGRVSRSEFANKFDIGYGIDREFNQNSEALILYQSEESLPKNGEDSKRLVQSYSLDEAVENCDVVKVVMTDPKQKKPRSKPGR
jgi:hypothetical protein